MKKVIISILLIAMHLSFTGCYFQKEEKDQMRNADCIIDGKEIFFVDDTVKKEWKAPLTKLLSNVLISYFDFTGDIGSEYIDYRATVDPNEPTIPECYDCGLLDITRDGIPELLVSPYGYSGSSLRKTYFIYDIYTGEKLGSIFGGADQSWCEYLYLETGNIDLTGQYWTRCGCDQRDRYITTVDFCEETNEYQEYIYLHTFHQIASETTDIVDEDPDDGIYQATWIESYSGTIYYIFDEETSLDQYFDQFVQSCIKIPETELILIAWEDVREDSGDYPVRGEKMAAALISSKQEYIDFNK